MGLFGGKCQLANARYPLSTTNFRVQNLESRATAFFIDKN